VSAFTAKWQSSIEIPPAITPRRHDVNLDNFTKQIQNLQQQLTQIKQHLSKLPLLELVDASDIPVIALTQQLEEIATAFQEFSTILVTLNVENEKLHQQNQELSAANLALEAERGYYQELFEFAPDANSNSQAIANLVKTDIALLCRMSQCDHTQDIHKESYEFLQTVIDINPTLIFVKDNDGKFILVNQAFADFYGLTIEEVLGKMELELHPDSADVVQFLNQDQEVMTTLKPIFIAEEACRTPSGELRWYQTMKKPLFSKDGQVHQILGVATDITQRKQAETQIQQSLREKEVLLQEIHHRVKNNLQVISSLLDLQSQHFQESCNRVKSMALVHELLYRSKDYTQINFTDYLTSLTSYLFQSYGVDTNTITLDIDIDDVTLNTDKVITCGLIVQELVSNALKYAFPNYTKGKIKISLQTDFERCCTLIIKDNGVGLPRELDLVNVKSLGLRLVKVLINQLEGTFNIDRRWGTEFKIQFIT
jgi:PAS domain S-box-containing protein